MIKINLLPGEAAAKRAGAKKKAAGSGALTPFVLGLLVLYAGAAFLGWRSYDKYASKKKEMADTQAKLTKLDKEIAEREKEFQEQLAEAQEIEEKFAVVQALNPPNRLYWSEKLNQLALAQTKAAVYVTRISMDEKIEEVETPESKARRAAWNAKVKKPGSKEKPPPVVKMPIIKQTLTVQAIAYGTNSSQRLQQVRLFMDALKNLEWTRKSGEKTSFFAGMNPEMMTMSQKMTQIGGVDVLSFGFRIAALEQLTNVSNTDAKGETPPAPPGKPAAGGNRK